MQYSRRYFHQRFDLRIVALSVVAGALIQPLATHAQDALILDEKGNVGIGLAVPARQLHLRGPDATFRMDRDKNTAAFILVRTTTSGTPLKTFVVGANASGSNNGEFVINDLGAAVAGGGTRRMTINNDGSVVFTGTVSAPGFNNTSSARYKENIETIEEASELVDNLRGVRFTWKDSGQASIGLIAEEVAEVFPELVQRDAASGEADAVNYSALTAVLIEALKEQESRLQKLEAELATYRAVAAMHQAKVNELQARIDSIDSLQSRLSAIEGVLMPVASLAAAQTP